MNLKNLNDETLIVKTENLVREERETLTAILHHLREIEKRRLFSALGYKSLFDFCVKKCGYSEDQAYRRISAMRLLKEIPELEEKLNEGTLTLSHISVAQNLFKHEQKGSNKQFTASQKLEVLNKIESTSVREAERIALSLSSQPVNLKPDRVQVVTEDLVEFRFTGRQSLKGKIEILKGRLAHRHPNISLGDLIDKLCDLGLQEWSQGESAVSKNLGLDETHNLDSKTIPKQQALFENFLDNSDVGEAQAPILAPWTSQKLRVKNSRYIGTRLRRHIFHKSEGKCEKCASTYALQIDHIQPFGRGGESTANNLRVLCRNCNQRGAIESYGSDLIYNYIK